MHAAESLKWLLAHLASFNCAAESQIETSIRSISSMKTQAPQTWFSSHASAFSLSTSKRRQALWMALMTPRIRSFDSHSTVLLVFRIKLDDRTLEHCATSVRRHRACFLKCMSLRPSIFPMGQQNLRGIKPVDISRCWPTDLSSNGSACCCFCSNP